MSWTTLPGRSALRRTAALFVASALMATFLAPLAPHPASAAGDVGYQDFSYSGASAPTGQKPQSKLWFNDGIWWGSLFSSSRRAFDIFRLDWASQTWSDTGVTIDARSNSQADMMWTGTNLFAVSAVSDQSNSNSPPTSGDLSVRVMRYSYSSAMKTYTLDTGFPVTVANAALEAVVMDMDTTGELWVTWTYKNGSGGRNVLITHSTTDTATFVAPYVLPVSGANNLSTDDISTIVHYNGKIGVLWSNENDWVVHFAFHVDGDPDTTWTVNNAVSGINGYADDHMNIKSLQADSAGQLFAAVKTSLNSDTCPASGQPLLELLILSGNGGWQRRTFSDGTTCETRPLVLLDPEHRQLYMFATLPPPGASYGSGGAIYYKQTSLDNPNFSAASNPGTPFIQLAANASINNVTSTKQALSSASGLVVLAGDDHTHNYVHNVLNLGPDTTPPTVTGTTPANAATNVPVSTTPTASFSEPMAAGTITTSTFMLQDTTASTSVAGTVAYTSSTNTATFTPSAPLVGGDSFTATVKGGAGGVTDLAGNALASDVTWSFSTAPPDTTVPTVLLTAPADGSTVSGTSVTLSATASDNVAVDHVDFLVNGNVVATDTATPYTYSWNSTTVPNGSTTITARAVDTSTNSATSSATVTVSNVIGQIFSDGFESGTLSNWSQVSVSGDGVATVQNATVKSGTYAAKLTESTNANSMAYVRKTFAADQGEVTISGDYQVATQGASSANVPIFRLFDSGGTRRFVLYRQNVSGALSFTDGASTVSLGRTMALATWVHVDVHLITGSGSATVQVSLDGTQVYSNASRTVTGIRTLQLGNDTKKQFMNLFADNIAVTGPGGGPTAPDTTITGGPSGTVNTGAASFTFTSTVQGSTFACSLDGAAASACTSPTAYSGLADGAHTFTVAATANGLTDATPATQSWTVDTTPPTVTGTTPANSATNVATTTVVTATFNEPMAPASLTSSTFTLADTTASTAVPGTVSYNGTTWTATFTPSGALAAGDAFMATVTGGPGGATDAAGNPLASNFSWSFTTATGADLTPPTATITAPTNGATVSGTTVTLSATASDNVAVAYVNFYVNGSLVATANSAPYGVSWDSTTISNGTSTITATAYDTSGNPGNSTPVTVTVSNSTGGSLFSDGFESGTFGAWTLTKTGGDGTATTQSTVVKTGTYAARLSETATSGSLAYIRETLSADQSNMTVSGDFQVFAEGSSSQNVPILRLFDSGGSRRVSLYRQSASGNKIYVGYNGTNYLTSGLLPLGTWAHFDLHIIAGTGTATVEVRLNGTLVYSSTSGTVPALRTIQIGNETSAQPMGLYADNIVATGP